MAIVEALERDIGSGKLAHDTRLPTHRELSAQLGLSVGTVTRAYVEAEERGLVRSEGRKGTFVGESTTRTTSFSNPFEPDSDMIDLSRSQPGASENPDLLTALRRLSRNARTQWLLQYTPSAGLAHHREAGAKWLEKLGMETEPDSIVISVGAQHAIMMILAAITRRGDAILSESHTYPGLRPIAELMGLELIGLGMDEEGLLPDELEAACAERRARVLYCNPTIHNPTATIVPARRRREIAAVAEKHGIYIIEDEAFRCFAPDPPPLITSMVPDQSFLVATVSKAVAAGLRVGFVRPPDRFINPLRDVVCATIHNPNALPLEIFTNWIDSGIVDETIARRRSKIRERQKIAQSILGPYAPPTAPTSIYIWLPLPKGWSATHFVSVARSMGVIVLPADEFATDRDSPANAVRICVGASMSRERFESAMTILLDILNSPARSGRITV